MARCSQAPVLGLPPRVAGAAGTEQQQHIPAKGLEVARSSDFSEKKPVVWIFICTLTVVHHTDEMLHRPNKTILVRPQTHQVGNAGVNPGRLFSLRRKYGIKMSRTVLGLDDLPPV